MTTFDDFVDSLSNDPVVTKRTTTEQRFPCGQCAGTGQYRGVRVYQDDPTCFACKGKGYFKTDPRKLRDARAKRAETKAKALSTALEVFSEAEPEMFRELAEAHAVGSRSEFIASLAEQLFRRGELSERQVAAWHRGKEKLAERTRERQAESAQVDLQSLRDMFEAALENGHKKPVYRAEGLVINRAPSHGANAGALYVKNEDGIYGGKVVGVLFHPNRDGQHAEFTPHGTALAALSLIAANPLEAAVRYGRRTGRCSCCGRELTNAISIEAGIGPICANKWGFQ